MIKIDLKDVQFSTTSPSVEEYQKLYATTGWAELDNSKVSSALSNTHYFLSAYHRDGLIGMLRVVGDNAMYFYIQDVVVAPNFRGNGLGKEMMKRVTNHLKTTTHNSAFVGLMAAEGAKNFYKEFGFMERGTSEPGMHLIRK